MSEGTASAPETRPVRVSRRDMDRRRFEQLETEPEVIPPDKLARAHGILNAVVPQTTFEGYAAEINRLWSEASDKFLAIGEYLILAKNQLTNHGEYERLIKEHLPFNLSAAHKMRVVAEAVRDGKLKRASLPRSYATAYELTLLSKTELGMAASRNLVRPDVFLREVREFRKAIREPGPDDIPHRRTVLQHERERLSREMARIRVRMSEIDAELENIADPQTSASASRSLVSA